MANFAPHVLIFYQDQAWFEEVELDITLSGITVRGFLISEGYSTYLKTLSTGNSDYQMAFFQCDNFQTETLKLFAPFLKHYYFGPKAVLLKNGAAELKLRFMMDPQLKKIFSSTPPIISIAELNGEQISELLIKTFPPVYQPKVIILDEDDDFREELVEKFAQKGFIPTECDSAPFFLSQLAEQGKTFDYMITDIDLPGSGITLLEVYTTLKKIPHTLFIPKLVTAAGSDQADLLIKLKNLGANEILPKPYEFEELILTLGAFKYPRIPLTGLDFLPA